MSSTEIGLQLFFLYVQTFYFTKNSSKSSFKLSYMGKVLTLPTMRVNAIFLRISIYVPRLRWLGVKFISNWTFELSEQVVITKISQKMLYFSCDRAGPYNILAFEWCLGK